MAGEWGAEAVTEAEAVAAGEVKPAEVEVVVGIVGGGVVVAAGAGGSADDAR